MRTALAALALSLAPAAFADATQPLQAAASALAPGLRSPSHHDRMVQRYCEKLREGPEAYAAFVKRLSTVTGYTFTDFAPREATEGVRHSCREAGAALATREQRGG